MSVIRVLIVDDDVPTRIGLRTILKAEDDIEVLDEAASAFEAVSKARDLGPDVVLMDVRLPDFDGIEATARIRALESEPKVIVLTTFDLDEYAYRSIRAGASGFLLKRAPAEHLVDTIRRVVAGESLPSAATGESASGFAPVEGARHSGLGAELTDRETDVLMLIARGFSNREIAERLGLSLETVRTHVKHIYAKCGARDRSQAVIAAYESGLISRPLAGGLPPTSP